ncbi:MAG: DUF3761 domain-containing protein [Burkholderiales bacterium]|nr:DUF3761 domain-containing protein [Burkholderiales bacterium]MDE2161168.1 DUF3761 domain-containing protein [Burkholderiales bacterium]MDE2505100.1 DUF3761 domain-containing protein [Burkholderiales bacterium]
MKTNLLCAAALSLFLTGAVYAAPPADAPAGTTGLCKDGSYSNAAAKKGACRGHKGVKAWYAGAAAPAAKESKAAKNAEPAAAATPAAATKAKRAMPTPAATAAPGGGAGMVWANDSSKVYHCQGDKWYGKTKKGEYMSEAEAKAKGMHADHGKACAK